MLFSVTYGPMFLLFLTSWNPQSTFRLYTTLPLRKTDTSRMFWFVLFGLFPLIAGGAEVLLLLLSRFFPDLKGVPIDLFVLGGMLVLGGIAGGALLGSRSRPACLAQGYGSFFWEALRALTIMIWVSVLVVFLLRIGAPQKTLLTENQDSVLFNFYIALNGWLGRSASRFSMANLVILALAAVVIARSYVVRVRILDQSLFPEKNGLSLFGMREGAYRRNGGWRIPWTQTVLLGLVLVGMAALGTGIWALEDYLSTGQVTWNGPEPVIAGGGIVISVLMLISVMPWIGSLRALRSLPLNTALLRNALLSLPLFAALLSFCIAGAIATTAGAQEHLTRFVVLSTPLTGMVLAFCPIHARFHIVGASLSLLGGFLLMIGLLSNVPTTLSTPYVLLLTLSGLLMAVLAVWGLHRVLRHSSAAYRNMEDVLGIR